MTEEQRKPFGDTFLSNMLDRMGTHIYITDLKTDGVLYINKNVKHAFELEDPEKRICWQVPQRGVSKRCRFHSIDHLMEKKSGKGWARQENNTLTGCACYNHNSLVKWNGRVYHVQNSIGITEYDRMSNSAHTNELTQTLNRRGGNERLAQAIERAAWGNQILALVPYGTNELKQVSNKYGRSARDNLLRCVTSITRECLGRTDFMFRLGGDEFVVLFYGRSRVGMKESMKRILQGTRQDRERINIDYGVFFSYGMTETYLGDNSSMGSMIARADEQMYVQKGTHHIIRAKERLSESGQSTSADLFKYNNETFYNTLTSSTEGYVLMGSIKTGAFRHPQAMVEEFGLSGQVVINAAASWGGLIHLHDEAHFLESNQNIASGREDYHNIGYRARNVKGEWIRLHYRGKTIRDEEERPELFVGMISNLGKRNQIDHMTSLYNKYEFEGDAKKYLMDHKEVDMIGLMILDLDLFKNISDLYDWSFGNGVLWITAQKVSSILPVNAKSYHLDRDESGVLCLDSNEENGQDILHKIQQDFHKQQEYNGREYYHTCSAGFTIYSGDEDNYLGLLECINCSLEHFKLTDRNRMTVFSEDVLAGQERRLELLGLLRESAKRGLAGFTTHYQPRVDTRVSVLQEAETLARWHYNKYGDISPGEFIPLLEQNGPTIQLRRWILCHMAIRCREWYGFESNLRTSTSLSYVQLTEGDIIPYIGDTLKELDLGVSHTVTELAEAYLTKADNRILQILRGTKVIGIQVAMDDFGVDYSSLLSPKDTPVDVAKIGRGFVKEITADIFSTAFIRSITVLYHDVGKQICLEGVEAREGYPTVREPGVESIQGFYFGHPVEPMGFEQKYGLDT